MKCFVCGRNILQEYYETRFGYTVRGRSKMYCSSHCRDYIKYFNAMVKQLDLINLDDEHKRKIRGDFFRVGNSLKFPTIVNFGTKNISSIKELKND